MGSGRPTPTALENKRLETLADLFQVNPNEVIDTLYNPTSLKQYLEKCQHDKKCEVLGENISIYEFSRQKLKDDAIAFKDEPDKLEKTIDLWIFEKTILVLTNLKNRALIRIEDSSKYVREQISETKNVTEKLNRILDQLKKALSK